MDIQRRPKKGKGPGGLVQFIARYEGPDGRERSKTFSNKKYAAPKDAARDFLLAQEHSIRTGRWVNPDHGKTRMRELAATWTDQAETDGTRGARRQLEANLGDLADVPIGSVTTPMIRQWLAHHRGGRPWAPGCTGQAENTISARFSQLKAMLNQAKADGMIPANPAGPVSVPRPGTAVTWADVPTVEELDAMIAVARDRGPRKTVPGGRTMFVRRDPALEMALRLTAATGMRAGEVAGLTWAAVDFTAGTISVLAQAAKTGPGLRELKTKRAGRRVIAVDEQTLQLLEAHRAQMPAHERVFLNHGGRPWVAAAYAHKFAHVRDYLGLRKELTPKSLRHFHATELLRAGVPIKTVQHRLGHASATKTLDVYSHFMPADDAVAAQVVAGVLAGPGYSRDIRGGLRVV